MSARCRSCNKPVIFGVTKNGKAMPLNPDPVPGGNMMLEPGDNPGDPWKALHAPEGFEGKRYLSHFATCPQAQKHRRAR